MGKRWVLLVRFPVVMPVSFAPNSCHNSLNLSGRRLGKLRSSVFRENSSTVPSNSSSNSLMIIQWHRHTGFYGGPGYVVQYRTGVYLSLSLLHVAHHYNGGVIEVTLFAKRWFPHRFASKPISIFLSLAKNPAQKCALSQCASTWR